MLTAGRFEMPLPGSLKGMRERRFDKNMKPPALLRGMILIGLVFGMMSPTMASDEQPLTVLRQKIDEGLSILNDPRYQAGADRARQGHRIWQLSREIFDYAAMSRLVLSSRWNDFTPAQQEAFTREFAAFLRRAYLPSLLDNYNGERIEYVRQVMVSSRQARVETLVVWRDREIPVTVKMLRRDGPWKIYDVSSLGISAVMNYRAQLHWMLRQETPDRVIEILRNSKGWMVVG
jgi:phospholipid transport system substrate-binding protein